VNTTNWVSGSRESFHPGSMDLFLAFLCTAAITNWHNFSTCIQDTTSCKFELLPPAYGHVEPEPEALKCVFVHACVQMVVGGFLRAVGSCSTCCFAAQRHRRGQGSLWLRNRGEKEGMLVSLLPKKGNWQGAGRRRVKI